MSINFKSDNKCWHINIYNQDKFQSRASWALEELYEPACNILYELAIAFEPRHESSNHVAFWHE